MAWLRDAVGGMGIVIAGAALFAAVGCGGDGAESGGVTELRVAHIYDPAAPTHECGAVVMAEMINDADVGLEVRTYPAKQLGSEEELLEQLVTGQLEMSIAGPSFLATWHEPIGAFDAAYAFRDLDHMMEVTEGEIGQTLWDELREAHGLRVLGTWPYGARHLTAKQPIRHPDDLADMRLRMPEAKVWQATGEALGARPVAIDFNEVYLALQQGLAHGQENPLPTIDAMGFHEVQDYLMLTGHIQSSTQMVISEAVWQRLNEEQREVLTDAVREAADSVRRCIEEDEKRLLEEWAESGDLELVEDVDVEAFRQHARDHFEDGWVFSDIYREITAMEDAE